MAKIEKFLEEDLVFAEKPKRRDFQDLTSQKFGRFTILGYAGGRNWFCRCTCDNITKVRSTHLKNGDTASCGCFWIERVKERSTTHGHCVNGNESATYNVWQSMKYRCDNPKDLNYSNYGGRGITVCERWKESFENFLADMGEYPKGLSLDRKENNKGYSPDNCRWATRKEQANNTRRNVFLTFDGKTQTMKQWEIDNGMSKGTFGGRIKLGWTIEKALTQPVKHKLKSKNKNAQSCA